MKVNRNFFFYALIVLVIVYAGLSFLLKDNKPIKEVKFSEIMTMIENDEIDSFIIEDVSSSSDNITSSIKGVTKKDKSEFNIYIPKVFEAEYGKILLEKAKEKNISIETVKPIKTPFWVSWIPTILIVGILIALWFFVLNNGQGGANKAMSFGKSRAKLHKQDVSKRITFDDVAGLKEEKEEMQEVVDFLKNPRRYKELGARIPKGVLMVGYPGTGKTYLSKAVAGEAGVPFYSISGSDFVEMFVGVGASRVRDLFATAKKDSPCIIFIDEIDAVGRRRGAGLGGGNDEREQTLNQLLVEMDGFGDHQGIIIIAATNRPDILDPALLRPGRFDRRIEIGLPDLLERAAILKVHSKAKPLDSDVDFKTLAKRTPYFTPADLENLLNEAALMTARKNEKTIRMKTIEDATTKIIAGVEKKSKLVTEKEKRLVSVHEAGHALIAHLLPGTDPVHQVTIIPRGRAGGFTMQLPDEEKNYVTKQQMLNDIVILLGGRVAEKVILGDISTGASNDLERVSDVAKDMVVKYAMSDNLSQMSYSSGDNVFIAQDMTVKKDHSEQVIAEIDREIRNIVDSAYDKAISIIENNKDKLENIAAGLYEYETLYKEDFEYVIENGIEALKAKKEDEEEVKEA